MTKAQQDLLGLLENNGLHQVLIGIGDYCSDKAQLFDPNGPTDELGAGTLHKLWHTAQAEIYHVAVNESIVTLSDGAPCRLED